MVDGVHFVSAGKKGSSHEKKPVRDVPFPTKRFTNVRMHIVGPLDTPETGNITKPDIS